MRVGLITQWFPPETGSAALPLTIARAIANLGHDVVVATGIPNYPSGRVYPGYRIRPHAKESLDGIRVHRFPLIPSHDSTAFNRMANYLSFAAATSVGGLAALRESDVVWVHGTPATAAIPAMVLKRLRGIPFVYHMQDLWPETVTVSGFIRPAQTARAEKLIHLYCDRMYASADHVAVTAPGMLEAVRARGVAVDRSSLIPNWADESIFFPRTRSEQVRVSLGINRRFILMYAGAIGEVQGLDVLIDAARLLRLRNDIGIVVVGDGTRKAGLMARVQAERLDNVTFLPAQPLNSMPDLIAAADAQLVCLSDHALFRITLPSKLQNVLASGSPVITAAAGDAARVTRASDAGVVTEPGDANGLARAILAVADAGTERRRRWGQHARTHYERFFSEARATATMDETLRRVRRLAA